MITESNAVSVLDQAYLAFRGQVPRSHHPVIDRAICSAAVWLGLYVSGLLDWDDLESDFHNLALRVDARLREESA